MTPVSEQLWHNEPFSGLDFTLSADNLLKHLTGTTNANPPTAPDHKITSYDLGFVRMSAATFVGLVEAHIQLELM